MTTDERSGRAMLLHDLPGVTQEDVDRGARMLAELGYPQHGPTTDAGVSANLRMATYLVVREVLVRGD